MTICILCGREIDGAPYNGTTSRVVGPCYLCKLPGEAVCDYVEEEPEEDLAENDVDAGAEF